MKRKLNDRQRIQNGKGRKIIAFENVNEREYEAEVKRIFEKRRLCGFQNGNGKEKS